MPKLAIDDLRVTYGPIVGTDGVVHMLDAASMEYAYRASVLKRGALGSVREAVVEAR